MKYLCAIHDLESTYKITGFTTADENEYYDKKIFIEVDKITFEDLQEKSKTNIIQYPKDDEQFDISKIVYTEEDPLQLYKYSSKMRVITAYKGRFTNLDSFLFLKYFSLSMELSDKGVFMYQDNIERILKETEEKNNEKLMKKVRDLADVIEEIEEKIGPYDELRKTLKDIRTSSSTEKIDSVVQKFLE